MKSKLESNVDAELDNVGAKAHVYHILPDTEFPNRPGFPRAVTIASLNPINVRETRKNLFNIEMTYWRSGRARDRSIASFMKQSLEAEGIEGVAICDWRDQFSRKRGRIIAKGRLLRCLRCKGDDLSD